MAQHIATAGLNCSLPESLAKLVDDQLYGFVGAHGFEARQTAWKLPTKIGQRDRDAAKSALPAAIAACEPASRPDASRWLVSLGALVAGNTPAADAQVKLGAYLGLLALPAGILSREALGRAGRRFRFFPSYSEFAQFVDEERAALENRRDRLGAIANSGHPPQAQDPKNLVKLPVKRMPALDWKRVRENLVGSEPVAEEPVIKPQRRGVPSVKDWMERRGECADSGAGRMTDVDRAGGSQ